MSKDTLSAILGSKIVSFHAVFAKALSSVPAAVMLSQGLFWQEKAKFKDLVDIDGEMYFSKTAEEWYEETAVTEDQQRTARAKMCKCGVLIERRAGLPAKMHYRVDIETLVAVISRYLSDGSPVAVDRRKQLREIPATGSRNKRGQYAGNSRNNIYEESLESLRESDGEEKFDNKVDESIANFLRGKKEKNPSKGPGRPQNFVSGRVDNEVEISEMETDYNIQAAFSMSRKVPAHKFADYLTAFKIEVAAREKVYHKRSELREHFLSFSANKHKIEEASKRSGQKQTADEKFIDSLRTASAAIDAAQFEY